MTKRTILIVIALLVVVDIIAALWYVALRMEHEGGSRDLFERGRDTTRLMVADTVDIASIPDTFAITEHHAWFVSRQPMVSGDATSHMASFMTVMLRWPQSVNGNAQLSALEQALLVKSLGTEHINVDDALQRYLATPHFAGSAPAAYDRVDTPPAVAPRYRSELAVLVYPYLTSFRLMVMEIDRIERTAAGTHTTSGYVHYDRVNQRVLTRGDILAYDSQARLLALINAKIDRLNVQQESLQLQHAMQLPQELCCTRTGIIFEFQEGEIAAADRGLIDVLIPYGDLQPCLTAAFARIVTDNDGYWRYKPLTCPRSE